MQYSHGICAATARPTRSFIFGGSAVIGFTTTPLKSIHAPGSARIGHQLEEAGNEPERLLDVGARGVAFGRGPRGARRQDGDGERARDEQEDRQSACVLVFAWVVVMGSPFGVGYFRRESYAR